MAGLPDFESEEFKSVKPKRPPVAQIINPRISKGKMLPWGFAITDKNAEDAGFTPPSGWKSHDYLFKSAQMSEKVHFCEEPRLLIISKTPLYLKLRETGDIIGEMKGDLQKDFFANKKRYKVCSYAWCYILDENNVHANTEPILIALAGSSGATFNASWLQQETTGENPKPRSGFCFDVEKLYHKARNQSYKKMGDLFHAHCIYRPIFEVSERGSGAETAEVVVVERYHPPTIESLIPNGSEMSTIINISRESVKDWRPANIKKLAADTPQEIHNGYDAGYSYMEDDEQTSYSAPVTVKPVASGGNTSAFSDMESVERQLLMEDTGKLVRSLNWQLQQSKDFLFKNFNKRGRDLLSTEELRQFKKMLEAEESKVFAHQ